MTNLFEEKIKEDKNFHIIGLGLLIIIALIFKGSIGQFFLSFLGYSISYILFLFFGNKIKEYFKSDQVGTKLDMLAYPGKYPKEVKEVVFNMNESFGDFVKNNLKKSNKIKMSDSSQITINGKTYYGNNVSVINGKVKVDGKFVKDNNEAKELEVIVRGEPNNIKIEGATKCTIYGNVSGNVNSHNLKCENIQGNVISHNVKCGNVGGSISAHNVTRK